MSGRLKESSLQTIVLQYLKSKGAYTINIEVSAFQSEGEPDIVCCYKGRFLAFETKLPYNKPTPLQAEKLRLINLAGGKAIAVYDLNQVREVLDAIPNI